MSPRPTSVHAIALWHGYKERCPYCSNPIDRFAVLEVDHIIPEYMLTKPTQLRELLNRIGKPELDLNSYFNWFPAHGRPCNRDKGGKILPDPTLIRYLDIAAEHEPKVRNEELKLRLQAATNKAFDPLVHLITSGDLAKEDAIAFISTLTPPPSSRRSEPMVLSFSIDVAAVTSSGALPKHAPTVPELYDWLIAELQHSLRQTNAIMTIVEDDRNGETVSVRYACWAMDIEQLPRPLPFGWELLQVAPYSDVYETGDFEGVLAVALKQTHTTLTIDEGSTDLLPYRRCPDCGSRDLERDTMHLQNDDVPFIYCLKCGWTML